MDIQTALSTISDAIAALMAWDLDMSDEDRQRYDIAEETLYNFVRERSND